MPDNDTKGMTDNRMAMAQAILNAIIDVNRADDGSANINSQQSKEALIIAMAAMLEANPSVKTPGDIRRVVDAVAVDLKSTIKAMRNSYETTGQRVWNVNVVPRN